MAWLQIIIEAVPGEVEQCENALLSAGASAITLKDNADQPLFEPPPGETPVWQDTQLTGLFDAAIDPDLLVLQLASEWPGALPVYRIEILEDKDWEREWMTYYHPMCFGHRLWICPSTQEPPDPAAVNLMLDPGLAFGTGTHPTTSLCLEWLDKSDVEEKHIIDYGCGSGVLAIAALLLGADTALAVDNDPQALQATHENARRNGIDNTCLQIVSPQHGITEPADIVLANILAGPLMSLAKVMADLTVKGGSLVLSGILVEQVTQIKQAYQQWFDFVQQQEREEWVRLHAIRR